MAAAIELDRVSKRYTLGEFRGGGDAVRDVISASVRRMVRIERAPQPREHWALRDVSVTAEQGETIGIIGRNGAGKTTLLKIVTRITEPTSGVSRTRGRVGALLEVGTGFHPELTGRENVYLNGAVLGMSRREIERNFEEIVEFAGVARFLDTPVKRYSSGMYLRLAFAVAAHLQAEIMAVDEVLAVGDLEFQRKCLNKMDSLEEEGRTVMFVTHNLDAVARLCRTSIWLDGGKVAAYGPTKEVMRAYLTSGAARSHERAFAGEAGLPASLELVRILDASGAPATVLPRDEPFVIEVQFVLHEPVPTLDFAVFLNDMRGLRVLEEAWSETAPIERGAPGRYVARIEIPALLAVGEYVTGVWLGSVYQTLAFETDILRFRLQGDSHGRNDRIVQLGLPWDVSRANVSD